MSGRLRRVAFLVALLVGAAPPSFATDPASRELAAAGTRGVVRTVVEGDTIEEIPLRFLGVFENVVAPGHDVYLVELEGPLAERVGVAAGMSGSPVYVGERLVGALAYRYGLLPRRAIGGVTPIEKVLEARTGDAAYVAPVPASADPAPIATPISLGGLAAPLREWLLPELERRGFLAVSGGRLDDASAPPPPLAPGMPVGVQLVGGDLSIAATGTVTWVDGDTVYAFGHPFFGSGRAELPMIAARVLHIVADDAGSVRLVNHGRELGAIVDDRLTAIVGRTGTAASVIDVDVEVRGGSYRQRRFDFRLARHPSLTPQLAGAAIANALFANVGYDNALTVLGRGTIRFRDLPDLPLDMAFSGEAGSNPAVTLAGRLRAILDVLQRNALRDPGIESISMELDVSLDRRHYTVDGVLYDRGPLVPGERRTFECVLRGYRGDTVRRALSITIPDELAPGSELLLIVGTESYVLQALGHSLGRRLETARDLATVARTLAELHSSHRLTAALYRPAPAAVADGALLTDLPGSAVRLLASAGTPTRLKTEATRLAEVREELDGPVLGGAVLELQVRGPAPKRAGARKERRR